MNQETMSVNKASSRTKIIKRYQNRKLYDTQQSCYVTLDDIAKMIRANEEVMVIDNKSKNDITAATLTQIIFEAEKKASQYAPLFTLREIIQYGNGSISTYLAKLGAFPIEAVQSQPVQPKEIFFEKHENKKSSHEDIKQGLEERVASAASVVNASRSDASRYDLYGADHTPDLPSSNKGFES